MADYKTFGKELARLNFGAAVNALATKTDSIDSSGGQVLQPQAYRGGMYFFSDGPAQRFFDFDGIQKAAQAFTLCAPLQSILLKKAQAATNARIWVMTNRGKGKAKECRTPWADKVRSKLVQPNPFETWQDFYFNLEIYTNLFGWCIIYPTYSAQVYAKQGFAEANALWCLPPNMLDWKETGRIFQQTELKGAFEYIRVQTQELNFNLDLSQILIIKGNLPNVDAGKLGNTLVETMILPDTRVRAVADPINNIIAAYQSRGELISFAGAQNIISPASSGGEGMVAMPLTPEEEKALQDKFKLQYGVMRKQWRNIISPQPIQVSKMGTPTKDLMLFEEVEADVQALCDQWGHPYKLLSNTKSTALNGTEYRAMESSFYQSTIIPETQHIYNQLAKGFKAADNNCQFDVDFSHIAALQEDRGKQAVARKTMGDAVANEFKNGMITYNRAMELMEEDTVEWGNIYYWDFKKLYNIQDENAQQNGQQSQRVDQNAGDGSETETETESDDDNENQ